MSNPLSAGQAGDIQLRRVGAQKVTVTPQGQSAINAGFTQGDMSLNIAVSTREIYVAEYGTTPADIEVTGVKLTAKWTMIQVSLKTLDIALSGIDPANFLNDAVLSRGIGRSGILRAQAGTNGGFGCQVLFHPLAEGASTERDITLWNAMITPTGDWQLSDQGDLLIAVQAECVVSVTEADGQLLGLINEAAAGQ